MGSSEGGILLVNNFLETVLTEWYNYQGYFVKNNVNYGKRQAGGYIGEIDVLAYHPSMRELIHVETSTDANKWSERVERINQKFSNAKPYYRSILPGIDIENTKRIAIYSLNQSVPENLSGVELDIELITIPQMFKEITEKLKTKNPAKEAVPENYPLIRAIQFASNYGYGRYQ